MSLLVSFTQSVELTKGHKTKVPVEVNADKIVSLRDHGNGAFIDIQDDKTIRVDESAETVKERVETAEVQRALKVKAAALTSSL